eukprot:5060539-Amphidinium_carterae.1
MNTAGREKLLFKLLQVLALPPAPYIRTKNIFPTQSQLYIYAGTVYGHHLTVDRRQVSNQTWHLGPLRSLRKFISTGACSLERLLLSKWQSQSLGK